jgi:hypothetical protein
MGVGTPDKAPGDHFVHLNDRKHPVVVISLQITAIFLHHRVGTRRMYGKRK